MGKHDGGDKEVPPAMDSINALLNLQQFPSLQELHSNAHAEVLPSSEFDSVATHDDFLEKMLSSVPASAFPWPDDHQVLAGVGSLEEQQPSAAVVANALMLQQQLLLSRGLAAGNCCGNQNDVVDGVSAFNSPNLVYEQRNDADASIKPLFNGFQGSLAQTSIQSQHFNHPQPQSNNSGSPAAAVAVGSSSGGATVAQPRQRVRARRGQATDPHSIAERLRRERIAERMKALQELVPNANKTDKASMLDEIIDYVKFLQLQVKVLSMSRIGCGAATTGVSPLLASNEGGNGAGEETAPSSSSSSSAHDGDGLTVTEQQVAKLMEEDMGAAMQYLQGKGLCLMPISLAAAVSHRNPLRKVDAVSPSSAVSALTAAIAGSGDGSVMKDLK